MKKYDLVITCFCISACGSDNAASQDAQKPDVRIGAPVSPVAGNAIKYEMKIVKKQIPDKSSPLGYWDINKSYPVIVAAPRQVLLQSLNKNIMALVNQYTCENKGEETVMADVTLASDRIFSMRYESMWMCASMPSPDSNSGTLNINIKDNTVIDLRNEFAGDSTYKTFVAKTLKRINQKNTERRTQQQTECAPVTKLGKFYVTPENLVVGTSPTSHGDAACEIEVATPRSELSALLKPGSALRP